MKTFLFTLLALLPASHLLAQATPHLDEHVAAAISSAKAVDLRVGRLTNPTAVNHPVPLFGWRIETEERGYIQTSYRLLAATSPELLAQDKGDLWDSGEKNSEKSQFIAFGGSPLSTGQTVHWKVRAKDSNGKFTPWSASAQFTVALSFPPVLPNPLFLPDSQAPRLSNFECSDPNLNKIYALAAQRLHEISGPRDIGLAMRAAAFHQEIHPRASAWLLRMSSSVDAAGFYPATLPSDGTYGSTQSDAAISSCFGLWSMSGDQSLLSRHWPSMKAYAFTRAAIDPEATGLPFGTLPADTFPAGDPTPPEFIHLMSQAFNLRLLREMGRVAVKTPHEGQALANTQNILSKPFRKAFLRSDGSLKFDSLTADLMALRCGLLSDLEKGAISTHAFGLLDRESKFSPLSESPFVTYSLLPALSWTGHPERALALARSLDPENLSPLALVSTSEWLISFIGGIGAQSAGWQRLMLSPQIPAENELGFAKARFESPYGPISTQWQHKDGAILFDVTIPPNTSALIKLPTAGQTTLTESGKEVSSSPEFRFFKRDDQASSFHVLSGTYQFRISK